MLNEMYKISAGERLEDINVGLVPHINKEDAKEVVNNYKRVLIDPRDIEEYNDYSALDNLKEKFKNG